MTIDIKNLPQVSKLLEKYPYIDIADKRVNKYKGLFVSSKYTEEVKSFFQNKLKENIDVN